MTCPLCLGQKHLQAWRNDDNGRTTSPVTIACPECSAPPAPGNGAAEMRKAAAKVCIERARRHAERHDLARQSEAEACAAAIRALPAPEVPE